jgi:acetyl-CoA synthetase
VLGTVGEPINPEAWYWYKDVVGEGRCPIVDTWGQTEAGGYMLTPLPGAWPEMPGSCSLPFFGATAVLLDPDSGKELTGTAEGVLCFKQVCAVAAVGLDCTLSLLQT